MTGPAILGETLAADYWHPVAHRAELENDRDYVRLLWPMGDLVVCNDAGTIVAFDNVCPHRGVRLLGECAGNKALSCPYHGWTYRNGRLLIPNAASYAAAELARAKLNLYRTEWCGDFLFAAVAPKFDLGSQLGDLGPLLAGISNQITRRRHFLHGIWKCDWRIAVENALEPAHLPFIHPQTLGMLGLTDLQNSFTGCNSVLRASVSNSRMQAQLKKIRKFFDLSFQFEGYISIFLFPFSFVTSTYGYSYSLQNFLPLEGGRTSFNSRTLLSRAASETSSTATAGFFDSVVEINRRVFEEDREICMQISRTYKLDATDRVFSQWEEHVRHFHEALSSYGSTEHGHRRLA